MKILKPNIQSRVPAIPLQKNVPLAEPNDPNDSISFASPPPDPDRVALGWAAGATVGAVGAAFLGYQAASGLGPSAGLAGAGVGACVGVLAPWLMPGLENHNRGSQQKIAALIGGGIGLALGSTLMAPAGYSATLSSLGGAIAGGMAGIGLVSRFSGQD